MPKELFVFTAGNPEAYQHYIDTIEEGFTLGSVKKFFDEETYVKLKTIYGTRKVRAWGAIPGPNNIRNWEKLKPGDRILIYRKGVYEHFAVVTFKIHNEALAEHLWGRDSLGRTWEYAYFLDNLTELSVPIEGYNHLLGYDKEFFPQGFSPVGKDRIDSIIQKFGSIDGVLKALRDGEWLEKSQEIAPEIKEKIIQEKTSLSVRKTELLEENLENFLAERVDQVEDGLKLLERQLDTRVVGRLDLLCEDRKGDLVVLELKKMKAGPSIIDQISRYMGWVMEHKAKPNQQVRGIIIVGKKDTYLEYSAKVIPGIEVKVFSISFTQV